MKKNYISLFFLTAAVLNTVAAFNFMHGRKRTAQVLKEQKKNAIILEKESYSISSLDRTITLFQTRIKENNPLEVTEKILYMVKQNSITVEKYQIVRNNTGRELFIRGKGAVSDVIVLLYRMAFYETEFHISYVTVDVNNRGDTVSLVMRVTYA